uniref:PWWP domain-containing protein n=1 Tax=Castor canadensis TaxID=51338 RepID=A0A8C0VV91_CASCN
MDAAEYVLCRWKGHLWPAKVLSRLGTSATSDRGGLFPLEVEVLSTDEKIQVNSTDITALSVSRIEALASSAGMPLAQNPISKDKLTKRTKKPMKKLSLERIG